MNAAFLPEVLGATHMSKPVSLGLAVVTAALLLGAFALPWWEVEGQATGSGFSASGSREAGAFSDGDLITESQANTAGILVLAAGGAAIAGLVLQALGRAGTVPMLGAVLLLVAALIMIAASLIAVTQWPGDDGSFWDEQSQTFGGGSATSTAAAAFGWFAAAGAGITGLAAGAAGLARR